MHVLMIEDRPEDRELIARRLQHYLPSLRLTEVSDEDAFRQALDRGTFDLVLTDYALRWTDGLQVLRTVKDRFPQVPVVMFTESGNEEVAIEGMHAGLSDYLLKRHADRLPAVLQASLERARLQRELDRSRRELEARVQKRTAELAESNERLREREEQLQLTMDATPALIAYVDADYRCRRVNQTYERWFGLSPQQVRGRPLADLLGPAAWEAIRPYAERALAGETVTYEQELPYESGGPRWVRATYTPDRDETGQVRGFIAHLLDIGERRRVEEELQRSEEKYRELVRQAPAFIYELDFRSSRLTVANDMVCEYLGYTREELLAMDPFDLLDEEGRQLFRTRIQQWLRGEKPDENVEYHVRARDGRVYDALLNVTFTADEQGRPLGATVVGHDITARRQAEQEREQLLEQQEDLLVQQEQLLEETQQQAAILEATFAALTEGVLIRDLEGKIIRRNAAAERMLGYTPEQWGHSPQEHAAQLEFRFLGQGREPRMDELPFWRALHGEIVEGMPMDFRLPGTDRPHPYLISAAPVRLPDGTIIGSVTTAHDISQLHESQAQLEEANATLRLRNETLEIQAEELQQQTEELRRQTEELQAGEQALQESEERLRRFYESDLLGVIYWNMNGEITEANARFLKMVGYTHEDLLAGQIDWIRMTPFEYRQRDEESMAELRASGINQVPFEKEYVRKDGTRVPVVLAGAMLDEGRFDGVAVVLDITERKRAEAALRETRDYLDNLLTYANAPVIVWDPGFHITRFNAAFERLTGLKSEAVLGQPLDLLFPADRKEEALEHIRRTTTGERWEVVEIPIQRMDGTVRTVLWNSATLYAADGKTVVATIAQGQDITERKQAEQEREQLLEQVRQDAETKATLLREVNHRVKNNLAAIIGLLYAQLDRSGAAARPEYRAAIQEVTHRIEGLSVVHGLLSKAQWAPLRLDELAERIAGTALQSLPAGQVQVEVKPSRVLVSPDQAHTLALALNELALNVGKHALQAGASAHVSVDTTVQENQAVLVFRDDGPGYPEEVVTGRHVGVGLGLLRNLVRQNLRGQMALRNEGGAVAEICFPLVKEAAEGVARG